jgi:hemolysin III
MTAASQHYTVVEEIAHSITHGLGAVLAIAGLAVLVAKAALYGNAWHITTGAVFCATLILLYTTSTLYHGIPLPAAKRVLRILDHAAIYLLIAGTYTPFALVTLGGVLGWSLFVLVWSLALAGVWFKALYTGRFERLSLTIYLAMGWCGVVALVPMTRALDTGGLILLLAGGLSYTGGAVFYAVHRIPFNHAVWHLCVLGGSVCHYFAVLLDVVPRAGAL